MNQTEVSLRNGAGGRVDSGGDHVYGGGREDGGVLGGGHDFFGDDGA